MIARCQQYELYAAEHGVPLGRGFATEEDAQAFVDGMRETAVWQRQYDNVMRVEVRFVAGPGSCGAWFPNKMAGIVEMEPAHRNELVVCHEVAHVLATARYGSRAHDPWFARTYLELVWSTMGADAFVALQHAFQAGGVDHDHDSTIPAGRAPSN